MKKIKKLTKIHCISTITIMPIILLSIFLCNPTYNIFVFFSMIIYVIINNILCMRLSHLK